jgi:hypothetical protein
MKTGHIEQHAQYRVPPEQSIKLGYKVLAIGFCQLPADMDDENPPPFQPSTDDPPWVEHHPNKQ